jgi:hypothetical protein
LTPAARSNAAVSFDVNGGFKREGQMAYFISIGSVGTSRKNLYGTGARGYEIVRRGRAVICKWAGIYVLGPSTYVWRRKPAVTVHRKFSAAAAKEFYKARTKQLQYTSEAYVPLGSAAKIYWRDGAAKAINAVMRQWRLTR